MVDEAKQAQVSESFEDIADEVSQETTEDTSTSKQPTGDDESGSDQQKPVKLESEVPKEFHNHPAWKRIMGERDEARKSYESKEKELEELLSKPYEPDESELARIATLKGYKLEKLQQEKAQEKIDELQAMLDKVASPQERDWWRNYASAVERKVTTQLSQKYDQALNQFTEMALNYRLEKSEQQARKHIDDINQKHGTTIDFDKDVGPEIKKMIVAGVKDGSIRKYNTDIFGLTKQYLADHGIEFGKRISEKQQRALNEKKKQANVESTGINSAPKVDFDKMEFEDIFQYTEKESV